MSIHDRFDSVLHLNHYLWCAPLHLVIVTALLYQRIVLTGLLQYAMMQLSQTENLMTSVERVMEYIKLKPEDLPTKQACKVSSSWTVNCHFFTAYR